MKSILYKGHFNRELPELFKNCWEKDHLLIFLPPTLNDYSFIPFLPKGEIEYRGELWEESHPAPKPSNQNFKTKPIAGVFSSGTSKKPRLVFYSKKNLESSINGIYGLFDQNSFSNIFCYPQPYHTFGLTLGLAGAFLLKKNLIFSEGVYSRESHQQWHLCEKDTLSLGTPTHFKDLIQWTSENNVRVTTKVSCIIGGARVEKNLWFHLRDLMKIQTPSIGYGASEASPGISHLPPGLEPKEDGEVGRPLQHVTWQITQEGLAFTGPNLCEAILEEESLYFPEKLILPDLIKIRPEDGMWVYQTRLNWFLNRGGEKFSLEKIEDQIFEQTGFRVLGFKIPCSRLGEDLGLLVQSTTESSPLINEKILTSLKKVTGRQFNQNNFIIVDDLPRNASEKLDRKKAIKIFNLRNHLEDQ